MSAGSDLESTSGWSIERLVGSTQTLHDTEPDFSRRLIRVNEIDAPSLVLGSTQNSDLVDEQRCAARGIEVAKRRSGGGVVSMQPGAQCWIDVFIPTDDPLWVDDVSLSALWLGECWARVAAEYGWSDAEVHSGPISDPVLSRLVCFAALGAGEVTQGKTKLVGISQRRTSHGAKFQCIAYVDWDPSTILDLVDLGSLGDRVETTLVDSVAALTVGPGPSSGNRSDLHSRPPGTGWSVVECLLSKLP